MMVFARVEMEDGSGGYLIPVSAFTRAELLAFVSDLNAKHPTARWVLR